MLPRFHIRSLHGTTDDYRALGAFTARFPADQLTDFEMVSPADLADFDSGFARSGVFNHRYLAYSRDGRPVGAGHVFRIPWLPASPRRFWVNLRVAPDWQRQGIGRELARRIDADLRAEGADLVWTMVRESLPDVAAFVERAGFREVMRTWPYSLDLATATAPDITPFMARMAERGLRLATLAELREQDPEWLLKLHTLHMTLSRDIPLPEELFTTPQEFHDFVVHGPNALPDAYFVVLDGERYVAQSFMQTLEDAPRELRQEVTGVLPGYRGCGLAQTLKVLTIDYALRNHYQRIHTWVESPNQAMTTINLKYGFVRDSGILLFEREAPFWPIRRPAPSVRPAAAYPAYL